MGVYVRTSPKFADRIRAWPEGTPMEVLGEQVEGDGAAWVPVRTPDRVEGFAPAQYLADHPPLLAKPDPTRIPPKPQPARPSFQAFTPTAMPVAPTRSPPQRTQTPTTASRAGDYFTVGSTKDEVLAVQGQPYSFTATQFIYGYDGFVNFDEQGRVTNWSGSGLKGRLIPRS
ncbi:MAG: SH3 domain-containing protein [Chloroflexi bacterium]|nr:SH3 domain-containing protein [Chloroflexota bacterium]